MRTKYATRAKQLQVQYQHDPVMLEKALDQLYAEQQQYEKGGNLNKELDKGIKVEMEHKKSLDFVKNYFKEKGKFPSSKQLAKSIAVDHIQDFKKVKGTANGDSYYDGLINNGLSDEVSKYVMGGNMNPSDVPNSTLEKIRMMSNGGTTGTFDSNDMSLPNKSNLTGSIETWNKLDPETKKSIIVEYANKYGIPPHVLNTLIGDESGGNAAIKNQGSTAYGLGQFIDSTWRAVAPKYGINTPKYKATPAEQLHVLSSYFQDMYKKYGNWTAVVGEHRLGEQGYKDYKANPQTYVAKDGTKGPALTSYFNKFGEKPVELPQIDNQAAANRRFLNNITNGGLSPEEAAAEVKRNVGVVPNNVDEYTNSQRKKIDTANSLPKIDALDAYGRNNSWYNKRGINSNTDNLSDPFNMPLDSPMQVSANDASIERETLKSELSKKYNKGLLPSNIEMSYNLPLNTELLDNQVGTITSPKTNSNSSDSYKDSFLKRTINPYGLKASITKEPINEADASNAELLNNNMNQQWSSRLGQKTTQYELPSNVMRGLYNMSIPSQTNIPNIGNQTTGLNNYIGEDGSLGALKNKLNRPTEIFPAIGSNRQNIYGMQPMTGISNTNIPNIDMNIKAKDMILNPQLKSPSISGIKKDDGNTDFNFAESLRFAPAIGSLYQALETKTPEKVSLNRMSSPEKLRVEETDTKSLDNMFNSAYNKQVGDIINTSGGSGSAARANMLASLSSIGGKKADAFLSLDEQNKSKQMQADQFNISNQQNVNQINNSIANQENLTNFANKAATDDYKRKSIENLFNTIGNIGKENFNTNAAKTIYKYDKYGNKAEGKKNGGKLNNKTSLINLIRGI